MKKISDDFYLSNFSESFLRDDNRGVLGLITRVDTFVKAFVAGLPVPTSIKVFLARLLRGIKRGGFTTYEKVFHYPIESRIFFKRHGYKLNLKNPRTFNEKVVWKKIHDRNPLLPITADKILARKYVREKVGEQLASEILVPLLFQSEDPARIPFEELPNQFVIKSNHASRQIIVVRDKSKIDQAEIIATCRMWLSDSYNFYRHEWAYQKVERKILVEELLLDHDGNLPWDYKFHTFRGKCPRVWVGMDRFGDQRGSAFDENWKHSSVITSQPQGPIIPKPENLSAMLEIARKLGEDFDYVRVDLYNVDNHIYFGELTNYPSSGGAPFTPRQFDFDLGANWIITPGYWKKRNHV